MRTKSPSRKERFGQPLARFWMHNGFLNINQEKMSKSLGNFFTIREILEEFDAAALRHYFLASHYRSPMDFSKEGLERSEHGRRIASTKRSSGSVIRRPPGSPRCLIRR